MYHWYDSTWDWTQVTQVIGEHSTHQTNEPIYIYIHIYNISKMRSKCIETKALFIKCKKWGMNKIIIFFKTVLFAFNIPIPGNFSLFKAPLKLFFFKYGVKLMIAKFSNLTLDKCTLYNCDHLTKWNHRPEFKSWMKMFVHLGKTWIHLFFPQQWVNSRVDWLFSPAMATSLGERKTLNSNQL